MCLIPRDRQIGESSLATRKPRVIPVCPVRSLFITIFFFCLRSGFCHPIVSHMISLSSLLISVPYILPFTVYDFIDKCFRVVIGYICSIKGVSGKLSASDACSSTVSFLFLSVCSGTHMIFIRLP